MTQPKKLIEVAMPVKEVSAESIRDINIKSGISTMHLWWARRPLPVCRATIFSSLVPDPLDKNCPQAFKDAVELLLGREANKTQGDPYKPYDNIPWTSVIDPMEDNLRNRLLMFIGKFSSTYLNNEKIGKKTPAKKQLSDYSLIKWENKNSEEIIGKARKLIFVAHNSQLKHLSKSADDSNLHQLLDKFTILYQNIKNAELGLYNTPDRHLLTEDIKTKEKVKDHAIENFLSHMPKVFDPFAGGGAIPLEAARLGRRSYGNDLNPVAHIIQKGGAEFPQKYGKPITYKKHSFIEKYGDKAIEDIPNEWKRYTNAEFTHIQIPNRLAFDVKYFANRLLKQTEEEIGHYYPANENGKKPIAYYWARIAKCANPSCGAEVPLLRNFNLCSKSNKKIYLHPKINNKKISFEIKHGESKTDSWVKRGNLFCPCCYNVTDVNTLKNQFNNNETKEKILVEILDNGNGKEYRIPNNLAKIEDLKISEIRTNFFESMPIKYTQAFPCCTWGVTKWHHMFNDRQLIIMNKLVDNLNRKSFLQVDVNYDIAIKTYLAILIDKIASFNSKFSIWDSKTELLKNLFLRQAISFVFDYPESQIFSHSTGSAFAQIKYIVSSIEQESSNFNFSHFLNKESGDKTQFSNKEIDATITDPPYYDAISYSDLSDFFYVWLKRSIGKEYIHNFATPLTPKSDECTALKHRFENKKNDAESHFESKLSNIIKQIEIQTTSIMSLMFAHQSTKAWGTICNSILKNNLNITSSWSIDTELTNTIKKDKAFLSSSITLACKPLKKENYGEYKNIRNAVKENVKKEVKLLYGLGFRGADLLTACFGQAVSEFGKYHKVEKADGTDVTVTELLVLAREAAFNAIISDIETDEVTKFYIGWLNLFGFTQADHDDVMRITQVGLSVEVADLNHHGIFEKSGSKQSLAGYKKRNETNTKLGLQNTSNAVDKIHRALHLFESGDRAKLVEYIGEMAPSSDVPFWRIATALVEVLHPGSEDHKQLTGLMANKESLVREAYKSKQEKPEQKKFEI